VKRKIKFRAWNFEDAEMIPGDALAFEQYAPLVDLLSVEGIMQCTARKDINKSEVYEHDIVKVKWSKDEDIGIIQWLVNGFYVVNMKTHSPISVCSLAIDIEVMGNIYENKELIS
jgi:uncharacterized phage protein (TIGR01671 family)